MLDLTLEEFKINEKEILKIITEVAVTRSEAEIVRLKKKFWFVENFFLNFLI